MNEQPFPRASGEAMASVLAAVLRRQRAAFSIKDAATGRYEHADALMLAIAGRSADEVIGRTDLEVFDVAVGAPLRLADQTAVAHRSPLTSEHRFDWGGRRHDFSVLRLSAESAGRQQLFSVWFDEAESRQREAQLRNAFEQIEQQQKANELLRREISDQGLRDAESGLYSRAHFEDQLRREVDLSLREHREFAIVFIELDPPGERVQALGEAARVRIFEAMGRLLRGGTRAMDASCRYDDQRFAVLLSGVGLATAHSRMESLRRQCATQIVVQSGQEFGFSVSMGVASFPHTAQTQESLLEACNAALAEAKRRGGNHVALAAIQLSI